MGASVFCSKGKNLYSAEMKDGKAETVAGYVGIC